MSRRRRWGHPFVFMLALGITVASLAQADLFMAAVALWVVWWTVSRG